MLLPKQRFYNLISKPNRSSINLIKNVELMSLDL